MDGQYTFLFSDEEKSLLRGLVGKRLEKISYSQFSGSDSAFDHVILYFDDGLFLLKSDMIRLEPDEPYDTPAFSFEKADGKALEKYASYHGTVSAGIDKVVTDVSLLTDQAEWNVIGLRWGWIEDFAVILDFAGSSLVFVKDIINEEILILHDKRLINVRIPSTARRFLVDPDLSGDADPGEPPADPVYLRTELSLRTGRTVVHEQPEAKK